MGAGSKTDSRASRRLAWLCAFALAASAARAQEAAPAAGFPGAALQARVESYARSQQAAWKADLPHYALVFPIAAGDLDAYMAQVLLRFDGRDVVLGQRRRRRGARRGTARVSARELATGLHARLRSAIASGSRATAA